MALFGRRRKTILAPPVPQRGAYIWRDDQPSYVRMRILLVGNRPLFSDDFTGSERMDYRHFFRRIRAVCDQAGQTVGEGMVNVYRDYVVFTVDNYGSRVTIDALTDKVLATVQHHLEWADVPILGTITSLDEYLPLSMKHNEHAIGRWPLGRYQ